MTLGVECRGVCGQVVEVEPRACVVGRVEKEVLPCAGRNTGTVRRDGTAVGN